MMKLNTIGYSFIMTFLCLTAVAQKMSAIVNVIDRQSGIGLPNANLLLVDSLGKSLIIQCNHKGIGKLNNLTKGDYKLKITYIGYDSIDTTVIFNNDKHTLIISLKISNLALGEINIKATKPFIVASKGKIVLNTAESALTKSGSLWDAMKFAPTVETSITGRLTIKNQSVTVYLDDRRLYLNGSELMEYLQSLSAENTDQIEIISHPGAAYPSDVQTVINIRSGKFRQDGVKNILNTALTAGKYPRYRVFDNLILNKKNLNGMFNYNLNKSKTNDLTIYQIISKGKYPWEVKQNSINSINQHKISANLSYTLNKKTSIFFYSEFSPTKTELMAESDNGHAGIERNPSDSLFKFRSNAKNINLSHFFQTALETKWDSTKQSLKFQIEYFSNPKDYTNEYSTQNYIDGAYFKVNNLRDIFPQALKTIVGTMEYKRLILKWNSRFGARYNHTGLSNVNETTFIPSGSVVRSGSLDYAERTSGLFIDLNRESGSAYYSIGMRMENYMNYNGSSRIINLFSFLPSLLIQLQLKKDLMLDLSYKKSISKPDYFQLNAFRRYNGNSVANFQGQENMSPQIGHNIDASFSWHNSFFISLGGIYYKNFISTLFLKNNEGDLVQQYTNFQKTYVYYVNLAYVKSISKIWTLRLNANSALPDINLDGITKESSTPSLNLTYVNSFTLPENWGIETAYIFNAKNRDGFFEHLSYSLVQLAIQKKITSTNLIIRLSGNVRIGVEDSDRILYNALAYNSKTYTDNNFVRLSLSWNFGKISVKEINKNKSESDDTINRSNDKRKIN